MSVVVLDWKSYVQLVFIVWEIEIYLSKLAELRYLYSLQPCYIWMFNLGSAIIGVYQNTSLLVQIPSVSKCTRTTLCEKVCHLRNVDCYCWCPLLSEADWVLKQTRASVTYQVDPLFINMLLIWAAHLAFSKCLYDQSTSGYDKITILFKV